MLNIKEIKVVIKKIKEESITSSPCHIYTLATGTFCEGDEYVYDINIPKEKRNRKCDKTCPVQYECEKKYKLREWI